MSCSAESCPGSAGPCCAGAATSEHGSVLGRDASVLLNRTRKLVRVVSL